LAGREAVGRKDAVFGKTPCETKSDKDGTAHGSPMRKATFVSVHV
jgi:hypothetical protein